MSELLRKLTEKDVMFTWDSCYYDVASCYYDVASETAIQYETSESSLGATLLQDGQPVAFASRSLSSGERQYAQIEKECLAIVFAFSRFNQCLHGRELATVKTDHKPLVPIFQKSIHSTPKRL